MVVPDVDLGHGPIAWKSAPGPELDQMVIVLDRRQRRRIVAEFIALPIESSRLSVKVFPAIVFLPRCHCRGRLPEEISSLQVMQFGHRQIAFGRARSRGLVQLLILGLLGPLAKFPRLLRRRDLRLFRLTEKLMRLGKVTALTSAWACSTRPRANGFRGSSAASCA
jgi:hypothetical protein